MYLFLFFFINLKFIEMMKRVWTVADSFYDHYKGPFWVVWQEPISGEPASIASAKWVSSGQAPNRLYEAPNRLKTGPQRP